MPNPGTNNQQQNDQTLDFGSNAASIGGYVSPYTHSAPSPVPQQQSPQPTPNIQDFVSSNPMPTSPVPQSGNILDNPEEVEQILREGQSLQQEQPKPNTEIAALQQFQETKTPIQQESLSQSQSETPEIPQNTETIKEEIPTVSSVQQLENIAPPQRSDPEQLNPIEDLKNFSPKDLAGNDLDQKFSNIEELLEIVVQKQASDLHITVNYPPFIRIDDKLVPLGAPLTKEEVRTLVSQSLTQNQKELLEVNREVDLSYQYQEKGRFRINAYYERGNLAAAYRLIPQKIRTITDLGLPGILLDFTRISQGLFLVTGPTGSGKSTTLSAMIQSINESAPKHILTIEDPIEYIYSKATALVDHQ